MAEAKWRQLLKKPAGVMPENVVMRVTLVVGAVMVAALVLTMGGGPEEDIFEEAESSAVDQGMFEQFVSRMLRDREQVALEQQIAAAREVAAEEAAREAEATAALLARAGTLSGSGFGTGGPAGGPGEELALQTAGEIELAETLRLEALERRTRSLRAPSLVQTFRNPDETTGGGESFTLPPTARQGAALAPVAAQEVLAPVPPPLAQPDPAALAEQMQAATAGLLSDLDGAPSTRREPQARTVPGVTGPEAAATPEPATVTTPLDPPGTERVYEGSMLSGVLVNQLDGDFAGPVLAQVAIPFYSRDRQRILVPRGTRLLGTAQPVQDQDQSRLAVGFHRMIWPDGRWVDLSFHGLNQIGEGALQDQVNRHYWSMFAAAGAVGVLAGLTLQGSNPYAGGAEGFRSGAGQGFGQSATQILQRFLNRMPTITIRAGHRLRVWVTSDFLVPRPAPHPERMFR